MRLFVGVELPADLKAAAEAVASELRVKLRRSCPGLDARWVEAEKLHITLWFLGEVKDAQADSTTAALQTSFRTGRFTLELSGLGAFPPSGPPRVFWLGVREGSQPLRDLHAELGERLVPLGFEPERREYSAHLTIARIREAGRVRRQSVRDAMNATPADVGTCQITSATLFRSRVSPKGSQYEALLRIPLR
jgi:RNA 2',3'-cyclic 3'-phosphodiesterase